MQTDHAYNIHVTKIFGQERRHGRPIKISSDLVWSPCKIWLQIFMQYAHMWEVPKSFVMKSPCPC